MFSRIKRWFSQKHIERGDRKHPLYDEWPTRNGVTLTTSAPVSALADVAPSAYDHPCQRCGSETWTDVDYSGCSDCREEVKEAIARPTLEKKRRQGGSAKRAPAKKSTTAKKKATTAKKAATKRSSAAKRSPKK